MSDNSQLPEQSPTEAQPPLDVPAGSAPNPPVKSGDVVLHGYMWGDELHWSDTRLAVKYTDTHGTPYVRYRFGKRDKPLSYWRLVASPNKQI